MRTYFPKKGEVQRDWYVVDAEGKTLGRLSTEIAMVLMGKNRPTYTPHQDTGGFVIVVNAEKIHLTGNKWSKKIYYRHSQYPGGLKEATASEVRAKHPTRLVEHAVKGMLPKNRIGRRLIRKLKVYTGDKHPHQAQKPADLPWKENEA
jgi:large subunit ribosomal protein L13